MRSLFSAVKCDDDAAEDWLPFNRLRLERELGGTISRARAPPCGNRTSIQRKVRSHYYPETWPTETE